MRRIGYTLIIFLLPLFGACTPKQAPSDNQGFNIVGAWELVRIEYPDGSVQNFDADTYSRCKIYEADSTYYSIELVVAENKEALVVPHELGKYSLKDSVYIECGRRTPFQIINDTTITTEWNGYLEVLCRTNMTEARQKEIYDIVHQKFASDTPTDHLNNFFHSKSERKLQKINRGFFCLILILSIAIVLLTAYFLYTLKRKKEIEHQLSELQKRRDRRPTPVTKALKEVETNFFQSDYYTELRKKIARGNNFSQKDWATLEEQLKVVYPDFTITLSRLFVLSEVEYQVCLLIKVHATPTEIASILKKEPSTISSMRGRLYHKVFDKNGGAKEWDEFILSL